MQANNISFQGKNLLPRKIIFQINQLKSSVLSMPGDTFGNSLKGKDAIYSLSSSSGKVRDLSKVYGSDIVDIDLGKIYLNADCKTGEFWVIKKPLFMPVKKVFKVVQDLVEDLLSGIDNKNIVNKVVVGIPKDIASNPDQIGEIYQKLSRVI